MLNALSESRLYAESVKFSGDTLTISRNSIDNSNEINSFLSLHNLHITPLITPKIFSCIDNVINNLKIPHSAVSAYVYSSNEINACCTAGNDRECVIQLSSGLIEILENDELEFVIGHEIGHFLYQHSQNSGEENSENIEFYSQKRAQEFSADRIGLLSCGSLNASIRAMIKTVSGLSSRHLKFNIGEFLSQLNKTDNLDFSSNFQLTHPPMLIRSRALLWFSSSEFYISGEQNSGSSELQKIDKKIQHDIDKYVDPAAGDIINELKDSVRLWLSASIIIEDERFDKNEQDQFEKMFGKAKLEKFKVFISNPNAKKNISNKLELSIEKLSLKIPSKYSKELKLIEKEINNTFS